MNAVRYYLALIMVVILGPVPLFWLLIHPFVRFWRRVGPGWTYGAVGSLWALAMAGLFLKRHAFLPVEFGINYYLTALGLVLLAASTWLGLVWFHRMRLTTIMGLPELAPDRHPQQLITTGVYAVIRHPRYVQLYLGMLGSALIANYLVLYLVAALWLPALYVLVRLEEKELRDRFGAAYDEYSRRVPRFLPRISRRSGL
ncbi:MAG: isoprenylcysteine carboxylmethyltransferase family protein [Desulfobaccales bacterium]|jgi:protein-S-isoprenylcysteine O-methyltransferase Ste14